MTTPNSPKFAATCYHCGTPSLTPLPRYEHDGAVHPFHAVCVGVWLMLNRDSVIFFFQGEWEAP
jgi:hypothetical protein